MEIKTITIADQDYPKLLRDIYDPPKKLFYQGELKNDGLPLTVVGTRRLSAYGQIITEKIVGPLAEAGLAIVSGLALGIDSLAHQAALKYHGRTIAVLGSGLDQSSFYPISNWSLAKEIIAQGGLILSEYPPGTLPTRFSFPLRNRIIAGLSRGTLVIEAPQKSGALITARCALEEGRDVFAVPGSATSLNSYGPNLLIKNGAYAVTEANDILNAWGLPNQADNKKEIIAESKEEAILLSLLNNEPQSLDELARNSGLSIAAISACLIVMEMRGKVKSSDNKYLINR